MPIYRAVVKQEDLSRRAAEIVSQDIRQKTDVRKLFIGFQGKALLISVCFRFCRSQALEQFLIQPSQACFALGAVLQSFSYPPHASWTTSRLILLVLWEFHAMDFDHFYLIPPEFNPFPFLLILCPPFPHQSQCVSRSYSECVTFPLIDEPVSTLLGRPVTDWLWKLPFMLYFLRLSHFIDLPQLGRGYLSVCHQHHPKP